MSRRLTDEDMHASIWPVAIKSTSTDDNGAPVMTIDDETGDVEVEAETWQQAGFASRPKDATATGSAHALRVQLGESVIVISTFDPRRAVACEEGEVVVYALGKDGASQALIRLRPDGVVQVEGVRTELHGDDDEVGVASKIETELGNIETELNNIATTLGSLSGQASFTTAYTQGYTAGDVSSTKVKIGG